MSFKTNAIGFKTIVESEFKRFLRIWPQSLLPSAITITLYFVIFGHFIGSRIGMFNGVTYMQFMAPGLIMMAIITNSYHNVSFSLYSHRFQHSIEEIIISPVPNYLLLLGYTFGGMLRGVIVGGIVTVIALFFTDLSIHHVILTISLVFFTAGFFSLAGFTNAIYANNFDDVMLVPTFILTPLTYLGGVFYSIKQLPPIWQIISKANPILYVINAFRYSILGISDIAISTAVVILITATVILYSYNLHLLKKGVGIRV